MMSHDNDMIMLVSGKKHLISGVVKLYGRSDTHGSFAIFGGSLLSNTGTSCLGRVGGKLKQEHQTAD